MAINERARNHYDKALEWIAKAEDAAGKGDSNASIVATSIVVARKELAQFCVDNQALVAGIDDKAPINPKSPAEIGGAKPWGGPP